MKVRTVARVVAMSCALLMAGWTGGASAQITTAMSCPAEYFPIVCSGPLNYRRDAVYNDRIAAERLFFHFSRAASAAGPVGVTLPSGSCAREDRAAPTVNPT